MTTSSSSQGLACIILAAGEGTRMRSGKAKVLHAVAGFPMIAHVKRACESLSPQKIVAVLAPGAEEVAAAVAPHASVVQKERLGTAHAVLAAKDALKDFKGRILVVYGDTPLLRPETMSALVGQKAPMSLLSFESDKPNQYGRVVINDNSVAEKIVEFADASEAERAIRHCNAGVMAFDSALLWELLDAIKPHNKKNEYYLTDAVGLTRGKNLICGVVTCDEEEALGVNSRTDLSVAEAAFQKRARHYVMELGVTLHDPASVYFSADTKLARDVTVEPHVVFGPGVEVEEGVEIRAFSHLAGVRVKKNAFVGPFARLRPGTQIGEEAHIGNFVELKKAQVDAGAKINHFSYVGDAHVGARSNIGAGTIFCNYDGVHKHQTDVGADVFVGSNSSLVAPVTIGDGATIAAGSVITENVPADAMGVARARQVNKPGWAKRWRSSKKG
jgi:bifunctional UDP-N-acetylglucosamine pyrophosphorylase/glucosamine-1-phosphate N-acetyltransferase